MNVSISLEDLFRIHKFEPNEGQLEAIKTLDGPLFLMAGPGSVRQESFYGERSMLLCFKTLIQKTFFVYFTEKAAKQLKDGLQYILGTVTNITGFHTTFQECMSELFIHFVSELLRIEGS